MTTSRIYPGMICNGKEYFNNGSDVMLIHNGQVRKFEDLPHHPELAEIIESENELNQVLTKWHGNNERQKQKQLARCRFGALNFSPDFKDGNIYTDHSNCPHRGSCIGEHIVCKPAKLNGAVITEEEITILREVAGNDKNTAIADNLGYCFGTFKVKLTAIYKKCGIVTKQQSALAMFWEGLL